MRDQPQNSPQNLRGLKALVAGMGVLIVIGVTVVAGTIIHRLYASFSAPPMVAAPLAAAISPVTAGEASLHPGELANGEHISGLAAAGPYVAIWVSGPEGDRILLLNPLSGQVRVGLQASPVTSQASGVTSQASPAGQK
jgi:hypothetical protein